MISSLFKNSLPHRHQYTAHSAIVRTSSFTTRIPLKKSNFPPPDPHRSSLLHIHWISRFKLDVFFSLAVAGLQICILNCPRLCCSCINTLFFYYRNFGEIIFSPVAHAPVLPRPLHRFYKILHCNLSYNGIVPWHMKYQDKLYSFSLSKYALNCVWVFRNILIQRIGI